MGIRQTGIFGDHYAPPASFIVGSSSTELCAEPPDYTLVCVKSFDSTVIARQLQAVCLQAEATRIVLCQNGWGNAEIFAEFFPRHRILNARVITGFERRSANEVNVTVHAQPVHIGSIFQPKPGLADDLCAILSAGGLPSESSTTLVQDLWAKMCYNCALNPLGAILGVTYGALADAASTRAIMDRIIDEIFSVMSAAGFSTHYANASAYREIFYKTLLVATAGHRSSMLQDITVGRRTEIEAMNGMVGQLGQAHDIATPCNDAVSNLVRFRQGASET